MKIFEEKQKKEITLKLVFEDSGIDLIVVNGEGDYVASLLYFRKNGVGLYADVKESLIDGGYDIEGLEFDEEGCLMLNKGC